MNKITSRDNPKLKHARKVRDGKAATEIFIEGLRLAEETVRSGNDIDSVFVSPGFGNSDREAELMDKLYRLGVAIYQVDDKLLQSVADTKNTQGIILIGHRPDTSYEHFTKDFSARSVAPVIFLNKINNPSNLGAILRTAEAAGVAGLIISDNSTDVFSPKALRASMGSSLRLNIWEDAAYGDVIRWARGKGLTATAADIGGEKFYTEIDWTTPRLLIFGSEAEGLTAGELTQIDEQIKIPMENGVESLNLAVSCGIILYEAKRQRDSTGSRST